jgi:hypothetical protein
MGSSLSSMKEEQERIGSRIVDLKNALERELQKGKLASPSQIVHFKESLKMYQESYYELSQQIKESEENNGAFKILQGLIKNKKEATISGDSYTEDYELGQSQSLQTIRYG